MADVSKTTTAIDAVARVVCSSLWGPCDCKSFTECVECQSYRTASLNAARAALKEARGHV